MKVALGSDREGMALKNLVRDRLVEEGYEVVDLSPSPAEDFVVSTLALVRHLEEQGDDLGLSFDAYGAGPFMCACKAKGMVAANISDERSAYMTREHNNARLICMGAQIVGPELACQIALNFVSAAYAGGRHQIRVDMLNKMA